MPVTIATNPIINSDTWNTTTYPPSEVVPRCGGTLNNFNVVASSVVLNAGVAISGDRGIVFPAGDSDVNRISYVNPLIQAGATQITYDSATTSSGSNTLVLSETITIGQAPGGPGTDGGHGVIPMSIRITLDGYITNSTNGSGGRYDIFKNDVYETGGLLTTTWTTYTRDLDVTYGDVLKVYVSGRTYTYIASYDKFGNPSYATVYYTGSIRYVRSRALNLNFQTTYPNLVTRS